MKKQKVIKGSPLQCFAPGNSSAIPGLQFKTHQSSNFDPRTYDAMVREAEEQVARAATYRNQSFIPADTITLLPEREYSVDSATMAGYLLFAAICMAALIFVITRSK